MRIVDLCVAKHMRMAEYKLGVKSLGHIGYVEVAALLAYLGVKQDVKEHVAKLLLYVGLIGIEQSLAQLVDLLYRIRAQRLIGLFSVPRTLHPQNVKSVNDFAKRLDFFLSGMFHNVDLLMQRYE